MDEQTTWTGKVYADLEHGVKTGLQLKKGDIITAIASGYVKFGVGPNQWAGPMTAIPPLEGNIWADRTALVALIGDDPTIYPIGTGVLNWSVPTDGELTLRFNDNPKTYLDNSGSFDVTVQKQRRVIVTFID